MLSVAARKRERERTEQDIRIARLCAYIAAPYRDTEKHPEPYSIKEFMPGYEPEKEEQTTQDMENMIKMINQVFQGEEH
jgi:hypothetical protein